MKKSLLSLCITFLLLALLVPMKAEAATVVRSGQLQDSYMYTYWKLYDDGSLVFTGNCNIPNYSLPSNINDFYTPWHAASNASGVPITSIRIEGTFKYIGSLAFRGLEQLTSVTLSDSIVGIRSGVFSYCPALKSITFPSNVYSIGSGALSHCDSLETVTIQCESISFSPDEAFRFCPLLKAVNIPEDCADFCTVDGVVFNKDMTVLYKYPAGKTSTSYTVPSSVISVCDFTRATNLTSITLPENLKYLDESGFYGCTGLTSISIPDGVKTIPFNAFYGCTGLTSVKLPASLTTINDQAFYNCWQIRNITFPEGLKTIGLNAFYNNRISNIVIPASVTTIDSAAFSYNSTTKMTVLSKNCTFAERIFSSYNDRVPEIHGWAGSTAETYAATYNATFTEHNPTNKISTTAEPTCTTLGVDLYDGCDCGIETTVYIDKLPHVMTTKSSGYRSSAATCTSPAKYYVQCDNCTTRSTTLTVDVGEIDPNGHNFSDGVCTYCGIIGGKCGYYLYWSYDDEADLLTIYGSDTMYGYSTSSYAPWYTYRNEIKTVNMIGGSSIGSYAFQDMDGLTQVTLPEGLTTIGNNAFVHCGNLETITMPSTVSTLNSNAFQDCAALTAITLPEKITTIQDGVFLNCKNLETVEILGAVTAIGTNAFGNCSSLEGITIPDNVTRIGDMAFQNCTSLTQVTIPSGVTTLSYNLFAGCKNLADVTFTGNVSTVSSMAFTGCVKLTQIDLPDSVTSIQESAFSMSGLTSFTFPENVTAISGGVLSSCANLETLVIPAGVTGIADNAFSNCYKIADVYFGGTSDAWEALGTNRPSATRTHYNTTDPENHWTNETHPATCVAAGYTVEICPCDETYQRNLTETDPALEHSWISVQFNWAEDYSTCSVDLECDREDCDATDNKDCQISSESYTAANCQEQSHVTHTATCEDFADIQKLMGSFGNHSFTDYVSQGDATCKADGTKIAKCDHCEETDVLPDEGSMLKHNWIAVKFNWAEDYSTCTVDLECDRDGCDATDNKDCQVSSESYSAATCQEQSYVAFTATYENFTDSQKILGQFGDHSFTDYVPQGDATCKADGTKIAKCDHCEETDVLPDEGSKLEHSWTNATCTAPKTCEKCGATEGTALPHPFVDGKCTVCGADDPNYVPPATDPEPTEPEPTEPVATEPKPTEPEVTEPEVTEPKPTEPAPTEPEATQNVTRLAGDDRFETSFLVAEEMKQVLGVSKFDAIVLASGRNFADALSGSYLAAVKHAPILLGYKGEYNRQTILYIQENLAPNGIVYILGGEKAVVTEFDDAFASLGIHYERLAGADRFETNLMVLREAGINPGDEILVCTGTDFADSLSGSATGLPILLVYKKLTDNQKAYLANVNSNSFCIVGGESAVSGSIEQAISTYGPVDRLAGSNRLLTSVLVAQRYFGDPDSAVVAYGWNFPDGLCGGPLAYTMGSPLILTHYSQKHYAVAADYTSGQQIRSGYVLGGDGLVGDDATRAIFSLDPQQAILSK